MSDRCEPPEELRGVDGWHWVEAPAIQMCFVRRWWRARGQWCWADMDERTLRSFRYLAPVTPPATVAALVEALENLMDVQTFATGWDNGVTDATGTMNEGDHWHGLAMDRARAALALYRGEAGR